MRTRRVALALLATVVLVAVSPPPAGAQEGAAANLALASQTPWVEEGERFVIRLDVDRVRRPQQLELAVTVHRAVRTRSQFARTIDGDLLGGSVHEDVIPFQSLRFDPGGAIAIGIDVPSLRTGVYPVSVRLVDTSTDDDVASLVTHLVQVPDEPVEVPLKVAWVQSYGADPALQPGGSVTIADNQLDDLRAIAAQLDAGVPLTITPTPETIAALATIDEGQTVAALGELLADHQVITTPFVDLDVGSLVDAGRDDDVTRQRLVGDTVLGETLGISGDNRTWAFDGAVTRQALRAVRELGVNRVVLDETAMEPLPSATTGGVTLARPFVVEGSGGTELAAVAVDTGLAAHFDNRDDVLAAHHLLADLAVLHLDAPGTARGVVIRPPADWRPSDVFLSTVLPNIATSPLLAPVTVEELFDDVDPLVDDDDVPVARELLDADAPELGFTSDDIDRARAAIGGLSSLLVVPADGGLDLLERLLLVAESSDLRPASRASYVDAVFERIGAATSQVRVLGDRTYRLTAREGTIPLSLVNDNDFAVQVDVRLTSDKLEFTDSDEVGELVIRGLVLDANRTTTRAIPVKARTSGAFPLRVTVGSPNGELELGASRFTITSTVASGVGILLSVGAGVFLLLWWGSHWRTVRRARRLVTAE